MKVKINNSFYYIDEGYTVTENYNETLDSANIRISQLTSRIENLEPLDRADIYTDGGTLDRTFCIDTWTETQTSINPAIYDYEISLVSETKLLEGIVLPNRAITIPRGQSAKKIWYYLDQYLNMYGNNLDYSYAYGYDSKQYSDRDPTTKQITGTITITIPDDTEFLDYTISCNVRGRITDPTATYSVSGNTYTFSYTLNNIFLDTTYQTKIAIRLKYNYGSEYYSFASRVQTKFNLIDCPEFQWNGPTLREVLTDLMMVADCIPVMSNNVIDYIDIGTTTGTMPTAGVNYIQRSMSLENYVSELRMDMQNVMQTSVSNIDNVVSTMEYICLTAENNLVTTENMILQTQFPIINIKHLWIYFYTFKPGETDPKFYLVRYDLADFVKEYKEYQTLPIAYKLSEIESGTESQWQNYCIYFNRGNTTIEGLNSQTKKYTIFTDYTNTLELLKLYASGNNINTSNPISSRTTGNQEAYYSTFFQIEYETLSDSVFSASKSVKPKHNRVIVDNQTNSWVDAWNQGFMEYQKANRLGNENLMINQRCITETPIQIGQVYDSDNIVYQTTKQYYTNHTEVNAYATKNYVLQNYFTGVKSKIRTWVNAQDEALIRHELYKTYCEFSFSNSNRLTWNPYLLSPIAGYDSIVPIEYAWFDCDSKKYVLNALARIIGNSLVLTTGFSDNYYVGKNVYDEITITDIEADASYNTNYPHQANKLPRIIKSSVDDYGGIPLDNLGYTNSIGEITNVTIKFSSDIKYDGLELKGNNDTEDNMTTVRRILSRLFKNPVWDNYVTGTYVIEESHDVYKDNREIFKASYQYEYLTDTEDIYITEEFMKRNKAVASIVNNDIKIYVGDTYIKGKEDTSGLTQTSCGRSISNNEITITDSQQYAGKALYIAAVIETDPQTLINKYGIMLGIKVPESLSTDLKFYLNLKRNRLD